MKALAWFDVGLWWVQHPCGLLFFAGSLDEAWAAMEGWLASHPDAPELGKTAA